MASPAVQRFYEERRSFDRGAVMNSVKYREGHKRHILKNGTTTFKGYAPTSVGSMNAPVVGSHDESRKPFEPMVGITAQNPRALRGGFPFMALASLIPTIVSAFTGKGKKVRGGIRDQRNYKKVKQLLKQRAENMTYQDNPEVPPSVAPVTLTDDDKYKIELNSLLTRISDLVDTGDYDPLTADVWRRAITLLAQLAPTFDDGTLNDMAEYWETLLQNFNATIAEKGDAEERLDPVVFARRELVERIWRYVWDMVALADRPIEEKILASKSFLREQGITQPTAKKILESARASAEDYYVEYIRPEVERERAEAVEAGEEEEGDGEEEEEEAGDEENVEERRQSLALRRFDRVYNRSPKGAGEASDELMRLFRVVNPGARVRRGARTIRNEVRGRLEDYGDEFFEPLSDLLAELVPEI